MIFAIDGRALPGLDIISYSVKTETLDGEATGRSKAQGWPLIRDVQGQIINLNLEFASSESTNPDFVYLWQTVRSMGRREFASIKFVDPTGLVLEQNMYAVSSELKYRRLETGGKVYTDSLKINFIAERGL